jgi:multicomponent Na+:H+ antiporter subunit C
MINVTLTVGVGVLVAAGVYLLLERALTRVLLGVLLIGNGANLLLLLSGGRAGTAPIVGEYDPAEMSDALPQAMILTAIVITFGVSAFVLAMAYRSWQLSDVDDVKDDIEDAMLRRREQRVEAARSFPDLEEYDTSPNGSDDGSANGGRSE